MSGSICAGFKKVVLRIMGIYPSMWEMLNSNKLSNILQKWCLKSKFSLVICTEDGTGGVQWMNRALNKMLKESLLNGVDTFNSTEKERTLLAKINKIKLIFYLRRFEKIKG